MKAFTLTLLLLLSLPGCARLGLTNGLAEQQEAEAILRVWRWPAHRGVSVEVDPSLSRRRSDGRLGEWDPQRRRITVAGWAGANLGAYDLHAQTLHEAGHAHRDLEATPADRDRSYARMQSTLRGWAWGITRHRASSPDEWYAGEFADRWAVVAEMAVDRAAAKQRSRR